MKKLLILLIIIFALNGCNKSDSKINNFVECKNNQECITPVNFLLQSNCPFSSLCINNNCKVVCPVSYVNNESCNSNKDCNCSERSSKSLDCLCVENKCFSVEG